MKTAYEEFDAATYLDNDEVITEYLSAAAEDPNPDVFVTALGDVARARGMAQIHFPSFREVASFVPKLLPRCPTKSS
jgi:DNA-binding phage protein